MNYIGTEKASCPAGVTIEMRVVGSRAGMKQAGLGGLWWARDHAHSDVWNYWGIRRQNSGLLSLNVKFLHFLKETRFFYIEV